ncbi:hypothetical protein rosag_43780 [Roseisolibacter agri]|uniref:Uncharacterized protein n=1 Tax=Roseisolibacter agri TaxID=2014610 RepID=A0AA37V2I6_9BACT|nr:hypothetical protein rosag_43780 [Roseisolibacter agri]
MPHGSSAPSSDDAWREPSPDAAHWQPLDIAADDPRLGPLAAELAAHFHRHCAGMDADAFERLVRHAAYIRLRWHG